MKSPLRPSGNPLLDDAEEDRYQHDLEKGNLKRKKAEPLLISQWESLGYWARIDRCKCNACGSTISVLVGVFLRERNLGSGGAIRSTALSLRAFRDLSLVPKLEVLPVSVDLCAFCVDTPTT